MAKQSFWFDRTTSTYINIIYTTKGTSSPILRRSEKDRVKLCDMKT